VRITSVHPSIPASKRCNEGALGQGVRDAMTTVRQIIAIAAIFRIALFVFAIYAPIANEDGVPVSPLSLQSGIDFFYFKTSAERLESGLGPIIAEYIAFYRAPFELHGYDEFGHIEGGLPITPLMMIATNYTEGNTLPLALVYLALSIIMAWLWLKWLHRRGVPPLWLLLFALIPNPLWFMLNISSDLPFAILASLFYIYYFAEEKSRWTAAVWLIALALIPLTRATGYSIILFLACDTLLFRSMPLPRKLAALTCCTVALVAFGILLYPNFIAVLRGNVGSDPFTYFGSTGADFVRGIYNSLPVWLDKTLSWLSLLGGKLLYFTGLRPSYGGTSLLIVLIRSAAGLVLLPGLIWVVLKGGNRDRLFIAAMLAPVLLGASQDRYNLPIQPLLFYFGWKAYEPIWRRLVPWDRPRAGA
jgi:hypothetical protein